MATYSSILAGKNPMDRGAWWALVHGVPKSQTGLCTYTSTKMNVLGPSWAQKGFPPCCGLSHLGLVVIYGSCCCCSVAQSCPALWDPMDCSTPGFPTLHYLLEFPQTMSTEYVMLPSHFILCCLLLFCPQSFQASGSLPMCQPLVSDGQSIRVSASESILPMNIQD